MQITRDVWCHEPWPAVEKADAAMTRAQSAARLSLDVTPGASLLMRASTRCPRVVRPSFRSTTEGEEARIGGTSTGPGAAGTGVETATTEDGGAGAAASSSRGASAEAIGNRELDGGVFWQ